MSLRWKLMLTFLVVIGASFAIMASILTGMVSSTLYQQRTRQATRSLEQLASSAAPFLASAQMDSLSELLTAQAGELGGRLLAERLAAPSLDIREINDRLDAVSFFADNPEVRRVLREALRHCLDMKRAVQRLSLGRGGPKDLYDLAATLKVIPALKDAVLSDQ